MTIFGRIERLELFDEFEEWHMLQVFILYSLIGFGQIEKKPSWVVWNS